MSFRRGMLSDYFEGVAVKRLSVVETTPTKSNQHEFNGSRPLRHLLGESDRLGIPARFIWLGDEQEGITDDTTVSWYDSRKAQAHRSAEFRLYYPGNAVTELMKAGDTFFFAMRRDGSAMLIVTPAESTIQNQLLWLFGLEEQPEFQFTFREITGTDSGRLDFAARYILDELGIEPEEPETDFLDPLIVRFGTKFPKTKEFSAFARETLRDVSARDNPDAVLFAWMEREELLFRRLERHIVADRIAAGFAGDGSGADVDGFLSFSLSVQQRRKSRVGHALENHLEALFSAHDLRYARGAETENHNKPDFLFPGQDEYRDPAFPAARLTMLGAKSTCKDRWRQVLSEAQRITEKHLLTLEPGISENQTSEMRAKSLQLVLPACLHQTYRESQRSWLFSVSDFLRVVKERQVR
ncbi:type II restriction endonuclease [Rhodopseudomonas parapalustris]